MNKTVTSIETLSVEEQERIIVRAQKDPSAFRPMYEAFYRKIFLFVMHRVGDRDASADVTQQVFLKAIQGLPRFRFLGLPFSSWLYRVAINECNEYFRKTKRERCVTISSESIAGLYDEMTADTTQEDLERKLPAILQRLAPDDLTVIELRFFEKRSFREIGDLLNLTEVNAKIKTYRILRKMKKLFMV